MNDAKTMLPNAFLKGLAVLLLYAVLGHPTVWLVFWQRRDRYLIVLGIVVIPTLLLWCVQVLVWRVRISSSTIEIRSLRGVLKRQLADIVQLERAWGQVLVGFKDGYRRTIPSLIGNLDGLVGEITSRRDHV